MHATLTSCIQPVGRFFTRGNVRGYRFGFNGKEKVDEVYGDANAYDFGARLYDPRLGRFLTIDPMFSSYPSNSPYNTSANNPIFNIDDNGEGPIPLWVLKKVAQSINGVITVDYSASVNASVLASWGKGMAVDKKGNVGLYDIRTGYAAKEKWGAGSVQIAFGFNLSAGAFPNAKNVSEIFGDGHTFGANGTATSIPILDVNAGAKAVFAGNKKLFGYQATGGIGVGVLPVDVGYEEIKSTGVMMSGMEYEKFSEAISNAWANAIEKFSPINRQLMKDRVGVYDPIPQSTNVIFMPVDGSPGTYEAFTQVTFTFKPMNGSKSETFIENQRTGVFFTKDENGNYVSTQFKK